MQRDSVVQRSHDRGCVGELVLVSRRWRFGHGRKIMTYGGFAKIQKFLGAGDECGFVVARDVAGRDVERPYEVAKFPLGLALPVGLFKFVENLFVIHVEFLR